MKLLSIIAKNFKLLIRSKSSAFVVTIGPLIITALVALAFSNSQDYQISIGVVIPDDSALSQEFVNQLKSNDYTLFYYDTVDECLQQVKIKSTNICIKLPENFVIENNKKNEIEFFVDQSRMNIVESIISSVSSTIHVKSDEITISLTENLLNAIEFSSNELINNEKAMTTISSELKQSLSDAQIIKTTGEESSMNTVNTEVVSAAEGITKINSSAKYLNQTTDDLLDELENELSTLNSETVELYESLNGNLSLKINTIQNNLNQVEKAFNVVKLNVEKVNKDIVTMTASAADVKKNLEDMNLNVKKVQESLEKTKVKFSEIKITSAENIVNPTTIKVNQILSTSNRLSYLFPYFLNLIILFVGIMLSSTLVVMEKTSRAFFRTFVAPTGEVYHLLARYLTNIIILAAQMVIIFLAVFLFLKINLMANYGMVLLLLLLIMTFFIFLGQFLGYIFKTQESITIASISLGSLFLFLSNLILPIESFPTILRKILMFNPYMLCSELLKKAILFNATIFDLKIEIITLIIYCVIVIVLTIIAQKMSSTIFFEGFSQRKRLHKPHITNENYFRFENGEIVKNKQDLLKIIKRVNSDEFKHYVSKKDNEFAMWIMDAFKEKKLAKLIKKAKTQENIIKVLEENLGIKSADIVNADTANSNTNSESIKKN